MGYHMHKLVLKHDTRQRPDDVIHICVADILPGEIRFYITVAKKNIAPFFVFSPGGPKVK